MKQKFLFLFVSIWFGAFSQGYDSSNVSFTIASGIPLEDTTNSVTVVGLNVLDNPSALFPFPANFTFKYAGKVYSGFSASPDGFIKLGSQAQPQALDNLSSPLNYPIIAPYWSDMSTMFAGIVSYKMFGVAPNRKFVIHWSATRNFNQEDFQLWLYERTGRFDFVYGPTTANTNTYSIGFAASFAGPGSFGALTINNPVTSTTINYTVNNGSNTSSIPVGTSFRFAPDTILPEGAKNMVFSSVVASCMAISWTDSSIKDQFYELFRSTDSINYFLLKQIPSTDIPGLGFVYTFFDTALVPSVDYFYKVNCASVFSVSDDTLTGDTTTTPPLLSGVKTIPGDYSSITDALIDIRCKQIAAPLYLELQNSYNSSLEGYPLKIDPRIRTSASQTLTIRPSLTSNNLVGGNLNQPVFLLDSAEYFMLDGRPGGILNQMALEVRNSNAGKSAMELRNDATHNTFYGVKFTGAASSQNSGVVTVLGSIYTKGNDHNVFDSCLFEGLSSPAANLLYAYTIGLNVNDSNRVIRCLFKNHQSTVFNTSSALKIGKGNSAWQILNNHFFQDASNILIHSGSSLTFIDINNTAGGGFRVDSNYFGGTAPSCGGTAYQVNGSSGLRCCRLNVSSMVPNSASRNVFSNFQYNSTGNTAIHSMLIVDTGRVDVIGNLCGSMSSSADLVFNFPTLTDYSLSFIGLSNLSNSTVRHNKVGGIYCSVDNVHMSVTCIGISQGVNVRIDSNQVGSLSVPRSIDLGYKGPFRAFYARSLSGYLLVKHNEVVNIRKTSVDYSIYSNDLVGIESGTLNQLNNGSYIHIDSNQIHSMSFSGRFTQLVGIRSESEDYTPNFIRGNHVYNLSCYNPNEGTATVGIEANLYTSSSGSWKTFVEGNRVHSFRGGRPNGGVNIQGMILFGSWDTIFVSNNMIQMGYDSAGVYGIDNSFLGGMTVGGIGPKIIFHNTIHLSGWSNNSAAYSTCLSVGNSSNGYGISIYNNLLENSRTDVGQSSNILNVPSPLPNSIMFWQMDNNLYYPTSTTGRICGTLLTLPAWQSNSGKDMNSVSAPPLLANPSGDYLSNDLHISNGSAAEGSGSLMFTSAIDFDGEQRSLLSPVDIGADAGLYMPLKISDTPNIISYLDPNPTSDFVNIYFGQLETGVLKVFDYAGKVVYERTVTQNSEIKVYCGFLPQGVYYVCFESSDGKKAVRRFIKV